MSLINRQGDIDNDGNVNGNDLTYLKYWLAASGGGGAGVYGIDFVYNKNGLIYRVNEEGKMRNFTNGNTITGNDLTYLKYWLAASGGGGEGAYDTDFVYNKNGLIYRVNTLASIGWSDLNMQIPNSNRNIFFEMYNVPYNIQIPGSSMTDVSNNNGVLITFLDASGSNVSGLSNSTSGFLQHYNDVDDTPLNSNVNHVLHQIKLKNDTLYQLPMSVPLENTLELIKSIGIYKFKAGHSYNDVNNNLGNIIRATLINETNSQNNNFVNLQDKDSVIVDHATYKLYIMRNNQIIEETELPKFPESGFDYPDAMLFT